jgi:3-phenylpropionate/trans-cinnamate dioxygenase ferredoxin reductase component
MSAGMVIIGAGMAGHRAVISLRANSYEGSITLIGEEQLLPYDRPPKKLHPHQSGCWTKASPHH